MTTLTVNGTTYDTDTSFAGYLYVTALLALAGDIMADAGRGLVTTSTTSYALGSGTGSITMGAAIPYKAGAFVVLADAAAPTTNYALVQASSDASGTTFAFTEILVVGSGTKTSWTLSVSGPRGATGAAGTNGAAGFAPGGTAAGDLDMSGYDLTVDFATFNLAGQHAYEVDATTTGDNILADTGAPYRAWTLTGDTTVLVAGATTPGYIPGGYRIVTIQDGTGSRDLTILPVNLLVSTAALSTQAATVTAAAHTLSFYGTGSVTLTGASTAGPLVGTGVGDRVTLTFTPSAGSLTLTVAGSVTSAQLVAGSAALGYAAVGATRAGMVSWPNNDEPTWASQAAATETEISLLPGYDGIIYAYKVRGG